MHVSREYFKRNITSLVKNYGRFTVGGSPNNPEMVLIPKFAIKGNRCLVLSSCEFRRDFANIANAITFSNVPVEVQLKSETWFFLKRNPMHKPKYDKYVQAYKKVRGEL